MAIDNTYYRVYNQINTEHKYLLTYNNVNNLVDLLIKGTLNNYQVGSFFQQNSDYITRILFLPFRVESFFPEYNVNYKDDVLHIGKLEASVIETKNLIKPLTSLKLFQFSVNRRFNNFLDYEPYRKLKLFIPLFKELSLDPQMIYGKTISGYLSVDFTSGSATLYIYVDNNLLDTSSTKLGIEISIGKTNAEEQARNRVLSGIEITGSIMGAIFGAYTGNPVITAGSFSAGAKAISKAMANEVSRLTGYNGSTGTRDILSIDKNIYLIDEYPTILYDVNPALQGKPLQEVKPLNEITGFTIVSDIHFNTYGNDIYTDEVNEILSLLKDGVIL